MTLAKLQKINPFITEFQSEVNEEDLQIANECIKFYARKPKQLMAGDIVRFASPYGRRSNALIEDCTDTSDISICENGSRWCTKNKKHLSVSGGSFFSIDKKDLVYVGRGKTLFCDWGRFGGCANGAIYFPITVNVWEHISYTNFKPIPNEVRYYQSNFLECRENPDITPKWTYAIFRSIESGYSSYHVASFNTEEQLKAFADLLGFTYTWKEERADGFKSGECSCVIEDGRDEKPHNEWEKNFNTAYNADASKKAKKAARDWLESHFASIYQAYMIAPENLSKAKKFKCLSNGSIVDGYFTNDGKRIRIYRCNPNARDFYKPLSTEEHIAFQRKHGTF